MTSEFSGPTHGLFRGLGPGSRIAGYLIEEQIGTGGMAVVFRARDEVLGRLAAVKVITPSLAGDEEFRARFLRESRAAAAVRSLHIIPVFGAGEADGLLYIATQFVAGGDLARLLRGSGGRLSPERTASIVAQVASALDAAHAAGLVHRDVKLQNILIDAMPERPEHVYLSDFGLSKKMSSTGLTASGEFLGTPDYCAPEQIRSTSVDGRTDQYALGCVAFALLTGTAPFHREDTVGTLFAHLQDAVPSAAGLRPDLPAAVDGVIARALAKSPEDRYSHCAEFAAALREVLVPDHPATIVYSKSPGASAPAVSGDQPTPERPPASLAQSPPEPPALSRDPEPDTVTLLPGPHPRATPQPLQAPPATDGLQPVHGSDHPVPTPSTPATDSPAAIGEGAAYAHTVTSRNGSAASAKGTADQMHGRGRQRGKATVIWAASGAALVLIAGVAAAVGFHVLPPRPGPASQPSPHLTDSQTSSRPTGSEAASHAVASTAKPQPNNGAVTISRVLTGGNYGFVQPRDIAVDGADIWVINYGGASVTELNASDGSWIRTLSGGNYGFSVPDAITADGASVWVTNAEGNSVTELSASDGSWIRTLTGGNYAFNHPNGIAADGTDIWVSNTDSVTELNASDGSWIRTLTGGNYGFDLPDGIAVAGTHLWVTNWGGVSVTELNASDGSWIRTLTGGNYAFNHPGAIVADGTHLWVTNWAGASVTELNASDGNWIRTLSGSSYGFRDPTFIATDGTHIWVTDYGAHSVTELNASDGRLIRTLNSGNGFNGPWGIAVADSIHIWVADISNTSVTELNIG